MDATGKIVHIGETNQVSHRFRKRDIVLEIATNPEYPETVLFQMSQDRCELLDNFQIGQTATIHFDLRGRKWTSPNDGQVRYFNTLNAWRIQAEQPQAGSYSDVNIGDVPPPPQFPTGSDAQEDVDEIPF